MINWDDLGYPSCATEEGQEAQEKEGEAVSDYKRIEGGGAGEIKRYDIDRDIFERCQCGIRPDEIGDYVLHSDHLAALAEAVAAETERCVKIIEGLREVWPTTDGSFLSRNPQRNKGLNEAIAAIRAREGR
jgi:hypothetical protein